MRISDFELPKGVHLQKSGGRPKKEARDVAVLLDKLWQLHHAQKEPKAVRESIIDAWNSLGIREESHIRRSSRKAWEAIALEDIKVFREKYGNFFIKTDESGRITLQPSTVHAGVVVWVWEPGMREAQKIRIKRIFMKIQSPDGTVHEIEAQKVVCSTEEPSKQGQ